MSYKIKTGTPSVVMVQHLPVSGDHDLTEMYNSLDDAIKAETGDADPQEIADSIVEYTHDEILAAAENDYGWPIELGFVEETDDE